MGLRRGFKTEASELATEVRVELGLGPFDCLDPHALAQHLDVPIVTLSDFVGTCSGALYLHSTEPKAFSALTVFDGHRRVVVHNDSHSAPRQNSDLAHELAHGLLLHEPTPALDIETGCRTWDSTIEEEADWLVGELLVTREMALAVARRQFTEQQALERLGVSTEMLRWRLNMTGASKRAQREAARRTA